MTSSSMRVNGGAAAAAPAPHRVSDSLFVCPITQELMVDPVMAADGYT